MIEVCIKEHAWLARLAAAKLGVSEVAIVVNRTIYLHNASAQTLLDNKRWLCHELKHVEQYQAHGVFLFLWKYLLSSLRHGYRQNKFEIEACEAETDAKLLDKYSIVY